VVDEGDELISTDLVERERLREQLELKKKKPVYNVYEDEDENGERRVLAQYDDEEEKARQKKRFVLDGTGSLAGNETYRQEVAEKLKQKAISLDLPRKPSLCPHIFVTHSLAANILLPLQNPKSPLITSIRLRSKSRNRKRRRRSLLASGPLTMTMPSTLKYQSSQVLRQTIMPWKSKKTQLLR